MFRRNLREREVDEIIELLAFINNYKCVDNKIDKLKWNLEANGMFSVKSFYVDLVGGSSSSHPIHEVWTFGALPCPYFVWLAGLNKILTINHLRKRGMVPTSYCTMCGKDGE